MFSADTHSVVVKTIFYVVCIMIGYLIWLWDNYKNKNKK